MDTTTAPLVAVDTLSLRAQGRIARADAGILRFAAMQPGGIRAWAEAAELDGYGRPVVDSPAPADDDDLVAF